MHGRCDGRCSSLWILRSSQVSPRESEGRGDDARYGLAVSNGKLQIVRYLHEYRSEGCTAAAMNDAASSGHLHVVKFLHLHRLEGCTAEAMDGASENEGLTVVRFLHANRKEGCTARAMDSAIRTGNLCMVKFLHENRQEGYHNAVLEMAVADDVEDSSLIQQYLQPEALKDMKARREFLNEMNFQRLMKQGRFAVNKELQGQNDDDYDLSD